MANEVEIRIVAQDNASAAINKVATTAKDAGDKAKEAGGHLGRMADIAGGFVIAHGLMQLPNLLGGIVGSASDLNESLSKMNVVFGASSGVIDSFAQSAAKNLGMSRQAATEAASTFGNLFVTMKMGQPAAAEMSKNLLQLAADLASFNNLDPGDVLEKLRSGLVGETEPMRALGVVINEAAVSAKGLAMGLGNVKGELSEAEKVQARYALILEQTKTAQGDFGRTADGMANSQRILKAEISDMAAQLGTALLPAMTGVVGVLTEAVGAFTALDGSSQALVIGVAAMAAAVPPAIMGYQKLAGMVEALANGSASAALKIGAVTLAVGALTVATDIVLQKATGHGLIETLFGDPQRADQLAASTAKMAAEIKGAGSGTELAVIAKNAREIAAAWDEMVKRFGDPNDRMYAGIISSAEHTGAFLGAVDALVAALSKANAPLSEYQRVMETLPEPLRAAFAEQSHLNDMMAAAAEAQAKAIEIITQLPPAMTAVATKAAAAKGPIQAYVDSLGSGENAAKNLAAALDHLSDRFSTFNPDVIAAKIELAAISEELDDAAASGRTWSDLFGTSIDALKSRQKDLEAVTKAADSNATAFKGIADQLQNLIGAGGVGALDQAMQGAGKTLEQQVTTMEQIGLAFGKIATNDIPGIEKAFAALKTNLTQQEWGVVGDALAAKFVDGFYNRTVADQQRILEVAQKLGVQLPTAVGAGLRLQAGQVAGDLNSILADALIAAGPVASAGGSSIGSQMGAGIAAGLAGSTGIVAPAAASLVQAGLDAARRAMRIFSPSRVMADQVGKPMAEGIAAGLIEGAPAVGQAMQAITLMALGAWGGAPGAGSVSPGPAFDGGINPQDHGHPLGYYMNPWGRFYPGAQDALGGMTMSGSWGTMPGLGSGNPDLSQFHLTPADFLRPWAPGDGSVAGSVFSQWRGPAPMSREQYEQDRWQRYSGVDPSAVLQLQFMRDAGIADTFDLYQYLPKPKPAPKYEDIEGSHYHDPWGLPADWAAQYGLGSSAGSSPAGAGGGYTTQPIGGITVVINIQGSLVGSGGINELAHAVQDELVKVFY